MNWVGPVLLTKAFVAADTTIPSNNPHHVKLTKRRFKTTNSEPSTRPLERKLTFSPFGVTSLSRKDFEGDRMGYWTGARDQPFDPAY